MTLKIESSVVPLQRIGGSSPATEGLAETAGTSNASGDRVTLTSGAQDLQSLPKGGESFDAEKVERLRTAIAEGRYEVNAERVATGLMRMEQELSPG